MLQGSASLAHLDQATRAHHRYADAPWVALMVRDVSRREYIHQLAVTHGFEAPIEGALAYTAGLAGVVRVRARARSGLLVQDLLALGQTPAQIALLPACPAITPFQDVPDALGWVYVVDRTTLLHAAVRRNIVQRLPEARVASAYLAAASSVAGTRWQAFGVALDRFATTQALLDRIAASADRAFRAWRSWLEANQPAAAVA